MSSVLAHQRRAICSTVRGPLERVLFPPCGTRHTKEGKGLLRHRHQTRLLSELERTLQVENRWINRSVGAEGFGAASD